MEEVIDRKNEPDGPDHDGEEEEQEEKLAADDKATPTDSSAGAHDGSVVDDGGGTSSVFASNSNEEVATIESTSIASNTATASATYKSERTAAPVISISTDTTDASSTSSSSSPPPPPVKQGTNNDSTTTIVFQSDWSKKLASPCDVPVFSPSLHSNNSFHGLGLRLAIERSRNIGKFLRNDAGKLLNDVAGVYDQFGSQLFSLSQTIRPKNLGFQSSIDDDLERLYVSTKSYSDSFRGLAAFYKTEILSTLQSKVADNTIVIETSNGNYETGRKDCVKARQAALQARSHFIKNIKDADQIIADWANEYLKVQQDKEREEKDQSDDKKKVDGTIEDDSGSDIAQDDSTKRPWEVSLNRLSKNDQTPRLIQILKDVEAAEKTYVDAVQKENLSVEHAQQTESSSIQAIQSMEQDRLNFYASSVIQKIFQGEADVVDGSLFVSNTPTNDFSTSTTNKVDWEKSATEGIEKTNKLFANLFGQNQSTLPYEEGMGVMDAETLGLPPEVGRLRDQIKSKFSERETRIKTAQVLIRYLNEISKLCKTTSIDLKKALQPRSSTGNNTIGGNLVSEWTKAASVIGPEGSYLWVSCINAFFDESKMIQSALSTVNTTTIENWLINASKALQNEIETDDAAWKYVCDSSRTEMKQQSRFMKQQASISKARERVSSVSSSVGKSSEGSFDSADEPPRSPIRPINSSIDSSATNSPNPGNRGRAFLFKGGEALKKFQENARVQIAKTKLALDEVDQKEVNLQHAAEEALEAKNRAIEAYKKNTEVSIDNLVKSDEKGYSDLKSIVDEFISATASRREERRASLNKTLTHDLKATIDSLPNDVEGFLKLSNERIEQKVQSSADTPNNDDGYRLKVDTTCRSPNIEMLLAMTRTEKELPELKIPKKTKASVPFDTDSSESIEEKDETNSTLQEKQRYVSTERKPIHRAMTAPADQLNDGTKNDSFDETRSAVSSDETDAAKETEDESPAMKAFRKKFWSKKPVDERPEILGIFQCSYKPKDKPSFLAPNLHGRLYTTKAAIYFLSWENRNFVLNFSKIISFEKEKGFMGASNDNAIAVTYKNGDIEEAFTIGKLESRDLTLNQLQNLLEENRNMEAGDKTLNGHQKPASNPGSLPPVPHDKLLQGMDKLVSKTIKNSTIKNVFEIAWEDKNASFYGDWLKEEECFDIVVPKWSFASEGNKITNEWCKESYDMERLVEFKFKRTTHLYIGPPIAAVKQRHYCRVEGEDRVVVAISAEVEGIPYSDTFEIEVRWVARRIGSNDVKVDVASFVVFKKSTMLRSQIKAGTITETQKVHNRFFEAVREACSGPMTEEGPGEEEQAEEEEEVKIEKKETIQERVLSTLQEMIHVDNTTIAIGCVGIISLLWVKRLLSGIFGGQHDDISRLENRIDELQVEVRLLKQSMDTMIELLKKQSNQ